MEEDMELEEEKEEEEQEEVCAFEVAMTDEVMTNGCERALLLNDGRRPFNLLHLLRYRHRSSITTS